jgi:hypothetical protein
MQTLSSAQKSKGDMFGKLVDSNWGRAGAGVIDGLVNSGVDWLKDLFSGGSGRGGDYGPDGTPNSGDYEDWLREMENMDPSVFTDNFGDYGPSLDDAWGNIDWNAAFS